MVPGTESNRYLKHMKLRAISISGILKYHEKYHSNSFIFSSTSVRARSQDFCGELLVTEPSPLIDQLSAEYDP